MGDKTMQLPIHKIRKTSAQTSTKTQIGPRYLSTYEGAMLAQKMGSMGWGDLN